MAKLLGIVSAAINSTKEPFTKLLRLFVVKLTGVKENQMKKSKPRTVDEYIARAPAGSQAKLRELRAILRKVAPKATEAIKWGSPVFEQGRILFSYTAYRSHLNFMPTKPALEPFMDELSQFKTGKDTIQFPYDQPLPKTLIRRIAAFRVKQVKENDARWMYKEG